MKHALGVTLAVAFLLLAGTTVASAGEVTYAGKIACAHCTLKVAGVTSCQDVLVVEKDGKKELYFITQNEVAKTFAHSCAGEKAAVVTGAVSEKDGKSWITPSKMEPPKA